MRTPFSCLIFLWLSCSLPACAQEYEGAFQELHFFRFPSAGSAALGKCAAADTRDMAAAFFNPALLSSGKGFRVSGSLSSPYYFLSEGMFNYLIIASSLGSWGSAGVSRNQFATGLYEFSGYEEERFHMVYSVLYNTPLWRGFSLGVSFNLLQERHEDSFQTRDYFGRSLDAGCLYRLDLHASRHTRYTLHAGAGIKHLLATDIGITGSKEPLPRILRTGMSLQGRFERDWIFTEPVAWDFRILLDHQAVLNSPRFDSWNAGLEAGIGDMVFLRVGYYLLKPDTYGSMTSKKTIQDFTYGFGIQIPVQQFVEDMPPIILQGDFISMRQPTFVTLFDEWAYFSTYSMTLIWPLEGDE